MSNWYLKLVGGFAAAIGRLDRYTPEHLQWLSSGYVCQSCSQTLMNGWGVADVRCYGANGERVSVAMIRLKGRVFECPRCNHRWEFRR
ncbi:MAG TPA: hypothetical protein VKB34_16930 [Povalibacter sp.]|nr:hypothetical protein [Povalibacter sp.]